MQDLRLLEIFLKLCAGRTGQLLNFSQVAGECGIDIMEIKSAATVNSSFFTTINYIKSLPTKVGDAHLVYGGDESYERQGIQIHSWKSVPAL